MVLTPADAERELSKDERIPGYRKPRLPFGQLWEIYQIGQPSKAAQRRRLGLESLGEDPRLGRPVTYVDELVDGLAQAYGAKGNG